MTAFDLSITLTQVATPCSSPRADFRLKGSFQRGGCAVPVGQDR